MNKLKKLKQIILFLPLLLLMASCSVPRTYPDKQFIVKNEVNIVYDPLDTIQAIKKNDFNPYIKLQPNRKTLFIFRFPSSVYAFADKHLKDKTEIKKQKSEERIAKKRKKGKSINYDKEQRKIEKGLRNYLLNEVGEPPTFMINTYLIFLWSRCNYMLKQKGIFILK